MTKGRKTQKSPKVNKNSSRRTASKKRRRGSLFLLYLLLAFLGTGVLVTLSLTVLFQIESFKINGKIKYSKEEIVSALSIKKGDNLFLIDKDNASETLKNKLPYVGQVVIKRSFPSTLTLEVKEAKPVFLFSDSQSVLTDEAFRVLEIGKEQPENVIKIMGVKIKTPMLGNHLDFEETIQENKLLEILNSAEANALSKLTQIDLTDKVYIKLFYDDRIVLNIGTSSELKKKIQVAKRIVTEDLNGEITGTLDLSRITEDKVSAPFREHGLAN